MSGEIFVSKFQVKNKNIYIMLYWIPNNSDLFKLKVFDEDRAWSGRFSNEFALKYRERLEETEEEYIQTVKECLTTESNSYIIDFTQKEEDLDTATFSWKKRFEGGTLVIGSVLVHREQTLELKNVLIDHLIDENKSLKNDIAGFKLKSIGIYGEIEKCQTDLEKIIEIKSSMETCLYGKFNQLLNSKKRRISLLEANLNVSDDSDNENMAGEVD